MRVVICDNGHASNWRNQRGVTLKNTVCPICSAKLNPARFNYQSKKWEAITIPSKLFCQKHGRFFLDPPGCWKCNHEKGVSNV